MAEQNNPVARELKWFNANEPDPTSLNVRELRGRSVNKELHMASIRQPPSGPIHVHGAIQNSKLNGMCLQPSINQSTLSSTLLKTSTGNPINSLTQNDSPHDDVTNRKTICDSNPSDSHSQTNTQPIHTHGPVSPKNSITHPNTSF